LENYLNDQDVHKTMKIPKHVAIILDGNRRYAKKKKLPKVEGHKAGAKRVGKLIDWAHELGIRELTLYIFSTENFNRTKKEKDYLFSLFREQFKKLKKSKRVDDRNIKVRVIGQLNKFPKDVQKAVNEVMKKTKKNTGLVMNFAMGYGGRAEVVDAVKNILKKRINPNKITEKLIQKNLYISNAPEIVIRPGGETRTSNFLMWQSAYSEWFFVKKMWPAITKSDFLKIIKEFNDRERRFGK
jgi:tritrans,polycis-undecaprenyl-diphosphate synthase [geranylgeranyl-diphosphate specific]